MPSLQQINDYTPEQFSAAFGAVYEHSPWIAQRAFARRPFADASQLYLGLYGVVRSASEGEQVALLNAHPELAGKEAQAGSLTSASTHEQSGAGMNALSPEEFAELQLLNRRYREQFGFPFIICVRLNSRQAVFAALRGRLHNSRDQELNNALSQVGDIARLRVLDLLAQQP